MATLAQNPFDQQKDENTDLTSINTGAAGNISSVPNQAMGQVAQEPERQGSGRFTNIQKFMQANPGAGQRIAGVIGQNIEETFGEQQKEVQTKAQAIGQAVDETRQKIDTAGQAYQQTFQQPDFNAAQFVQGPPSQTEGEVQPAQVEGEPQGMQYNPTFGGYVDLMSGKYIDREGITRQLDDATLLQLKAQQRAENITEALSSQEGGALGGRFGLLKEIFGRTAPLYRTGMQRLDQALLQTDPSGALQNIQQKEAQRLEDIKNIGQALTGEGGASQRFSDLIKREDQIQKELKQTVDDIKSAATESSMQRAQARLDDIQKKRSDMQFATQEALGWLTGTKAAPINGQIGTGAVTYNMDAVRKGLEILGLDTRMLDEPDLYQGSYSSEKMKTGESLQSLIDQNLDFSQPISTDLANYIQEQDALNLNALNQIANLMPEKEELFKVGQFATRNPTIARIDGGAIRDIILKEDMARKAAKKAAIEEELRMYEEEAARKRLREATASLNMGSHAEQNARLEEERIKRVKKENEAFIKKQKEILDNEANRRTGSF